MRLKRLTAALIMFVCACSLVLYATPEPISTEQVGMQVPISSQGTPATDWSGVERVMAQRVWYGAVADQNAAKAASAARRRATQTRIVERSPEAPVAADGSVWQRLARCESGMTNANTGNGFYGYFQFVVSTWHSVGGTGLPTDHDYAEQQSRAQILQERSGWGQWPACARKLGLI